MTNEELYLILKELKLTEGVSHKWIAEHSKINQGQLYYAIERRRFSPQMKDAIISCLEKDLNERYISIKSKLNIA